MVSFTGFQETATKINYYLPSGLLNLKQEKNSTCARMQPKIAHVRCHWSEV